MILKFLLAFVVFVFSGFVGDDNKTLMWILKIIGFLIIASIYF